MQKSTVVLIAICTLLLLNSCGDSADTYIRSSEAKMQVQKYNEAVAELDKAIEINDESERESPIYE
jgi:hypothetical protein